MSNKESARGGRKNPNPLSLREPEQIARLGLTMGYDTNHVIDTVVAKCNLTQSEAKRIVEDVAQKQSEGSSH
jgi:hypothetical protein